MREVASARAATFARSSGSSGSSVRKNQLPPQATSPVDAAEAGHLHRDVARVAEGRHVLDRDRAVRPRARRPPCRPACRSGRARARAGRGTRASATTPMRPWPHIPRAPALLKKTTPAAEPGSTGGVSSAPDDRVVAARLADDGLAQPVLRGRARNARRSAIVAALGLRPARRPRPASARPRCASRRPRCAPEAGSHRVSRERAVDQAPDAPRVRRRGAPRAAPPPGSPGSRPAARSAGSRPSRPRSRAGRSWPDRARRGASRGTPRRRSGSRSRSGGRPCGAAPPRAPGTPRGRARCRAPWRSGDPGGRAPAASISGARRSAPRRWPGRRSPPRAAGSPGTSRRRSRGGRRCASVCRVRPRTPERAPRSPRPGSEPPSREPCVVRGLDARVHHRARRPRRRGGRRSDRKALETGASTTTVRPGFVQNWPEPSVTEAASPFAIASPRSASAPGRTKTGSTSPSRRRRGSAPAAAPPRRRARGRREGAR